MEPKIHGKGLYKCCDCRTQQQNFVSKTSASGKLYSDSTDRECIVFGIANTNPDRLVMYMLSDVL
jgi:hypothetical protein